MKAVAALVLDAETSTDGSGVEVHFSNFPGTWRPGRPIEITELGFTSGAEAVVKVKELGLPLKQVDVKPGSAPMPARDNHVASEEQARALPADTAADEPADETGSDDKGDD